MAHPRLPDGIRRDIIARYLKKESAQSIADSLGISFGGVYKVLREEGVRASLQPIPEGVIQDILNRYRLGESAQNIADNLKLSRSSVFGIIRKNGGPNRKMHSLSEGQHAEVVDRYKAGESIDQIAKDFTVHKETIRNALEKLSLIRPETRKPRIGEIKKRAIINAIKSGANTPQVRAQFGVNETLVVRLLRAERARGEIVNLAQGRPRVYAINEHMFDILTPEALYWLGFIFADGCVYKNCLILCLSIVDIEHVDKFRQFLCSTHPIRIRPSGTSYNSNSMFARYSVRSKHMCERLVELGIVAKRVRTPSREISISRDFWRGAIDGDGNLGVSNFGRYMYPHFGLAGQIPLLNSFRDFMVTNGLPSLNPHKSDEDAVHSISSTAGTARNLIDLLYRGARVSLDRKMIRAQQIIAGNFERSKPYIEGPSLALIDDEIAEQCAAEENEL